MALRVACVLMAQYCCSFMQSLCRPGEGRGSRHLEVLYQLEVMSNVFTYHNQGSGECTSVMALKFKAACT